MFDAEFQKRIQENPDLRKQLDEILISLDKERIIQFAKDNGIKAKPPESDVPFWFPVHLCRLTIPHLTKEQENQSIRWLKENSEEIDVGLFLWGFAKAWMSLSRLPVGLLSRKRLD